MNKFSLESVNIVSTPLITNVHSQMILPSYTSHDWLKNSFDLWVQRCQSAQSAESIEILTEVLIPFLLYCFFFL